ncbi:MAG: hypothetical protein WCK78_14945 [Paludibacter sp.]
MIYTSKGDVKSGLQSDSLCGFYAFFTPFFGSPDEVDWFCSHIYFNASALKEYILLF